MWFVNNVSHSVGCLSNFFFFLKFIYLFIYFWLCWVLVSERGLSPVAASGAHSSSRCTGLSLPRPLLLRSTGSRRAGSVVVAHGPSRSAACGIPPDQGSNPCTLHWQAASQPLRHQGSPAFPIFDDILWSIKVLNLDEVQFIYFFLLLFVLLCLCFCAFVVISKKTLLNLSSQRSTLTFPSKSFIILTHTFSFLIHFGVDFCICVRKGVQLHSFACGYTVVPALFGENTIFSQFDCKKPIVRKWKALFQGSHF